MSDLGDLEELIDHLARTSRLTPREAARVVDEVLEFLGETPEAFIRRRHYALQAEGLSNPAIFAQLAEEVARRRFRAPRYTARQIRRIIYG
jgi:thioesterase domain-containing protein